MTKNRKESVSVFHIIQRELKEEKELRPNLDKYSFLKKRIAKLLKGTDYREKIKELDINLFKVIFDWNRIDEKNILYDNEMNNWLYYTGYNEETEEGSYRLVYDLIELAKMPFSKFSAPFIVDKKEDLPKGTEVQYLTPDEKGIAELYVTYLEFEDKGNDEPELDQLTNLFKVVSPDYYKHPGELEAPLNKEETPNSEKPRKIKKEENIFRHDGATWTVRYNGITKTIKHTKGMDYIAFLLRHQGQKIHSMKMYQAMSGFIPNVDERRSGTTGKRTLKDEGLQVGDKYTFPIVDRQTIDAVKNRIEQLKDEHEQAMIKNDSVRENEISIKLDKLNDYLSKCTYKGKIRTISDATERMRQSIFRAITTVKKNIREHHKKLFKHLDKFITTGTYNSYSQDTPVSWVQDQ